jgi:hypothetical protein
MGRGCTVKELLAELIKMHTFRRPMGSKAEQQFIKEYIQPLPGSEQDKFGNWHVQVGRDSRVLWSCHTDTVHNEQGRQRVDYRDGILTLAPNEKSVKTHGVYTDVKGRKVQTYKIVKRGRSNCLGADDTAGVFIMRNMVLRGVPGNYVFHYGEERGASGSRNLSRCGKFLEFFDYAIAFDRHGYNDIITEQGGGYCASDVFASSLAKQLEHHGLEYEASQYGIFTDTANYTDDISECTNLSVGYSDEHTDDEALDCTYVLRLLDAVSNLDETQLEVDRRPGENFNPATGPDDFDLAKYYNSPRIYDAADYLNEDFSEVQKQLAADLRELVKRKVG